MQFFDPARDPSRVNNLALPVELAKVNGLQTLLQQRFERLEQQRISGIRQYAPYLGFFDLDGTLVRRGTTDTTRDLFTSIEPDLSNSQSSPNEGIAVVITGSTLSNFFKKRYTRDYFPFLPSVLATSGGGELYLLVEDKPDFTGAMDRYKKLEAYHEFLRPRVQAFDREEAFRKLEMFIESFDDPKFRLQFREGEHADTSDPQSIGRIILEAVPFESVDCVPEDRRDISLKVERGLQQLFQKESYPHLDCFSLYDSLELKQTRVRFNVSAHTKASVVEFLMQRLNKYVEDWRILGSGDGGNDRFLAAAVLQQRNGIFVPVAQAEASLLTYLSSQTGGCQPGESYIAQSGALVVYPACDWTNGPSTLLEFFRSPAWLNQPPDLATTTLPVDSSR